MTDINEARRSLVAAGAEITREIASVPTGQTMYARHPDCAVVEYVQWTPDLVERIIDAARRAGTLASAI